MDAIALPQRVFRAAFVLLPLLVLLVWASSAHASITSFTSSPSSPIVGEEVTVTANYLAECETTFTFTINGQLTPHTDLGWSDARGANSAIARTRFATAGDHTARVTLAQCESMFDAREIVISVGAALEGTIALSPDPPVVDLPLTLSATQTGGYAPYTYAWDSDNDGQFDDETSRVITKSYATTGSRAVRVRITDAASHQTTVTHTFTVNEAPKPPSPPPPGDDTPPPPPPPPPCVRELAFALSEFTTSGCFSNVSSGRWETTSAVKLNGLSFPDFGQTFVVTYPTAADPGGRFAASNAALQLGDLTVYSGPIDWKLPAGKQGEEQTVTSLAVPRFARLFGLNVVGSAALRLGWGADGKHYAMLPLNVQLPAIFKPGPDPSSGDSISGTTALRVDDGGPQFNGLKLTVRDAWVGRIRVPEACFSYLPAGSQIASPCPAPSLDGEPYLTCQNDAGTDRWNGNAILELPIEGNPQYAAFGGFAGGQLSSLGGFTDRFPLKAQLAPGVLLRRLGAGVCLTPPPLTLRGDVGIEAAGMLTVNGRFIYTDGASGRPWSLTVGGNARIGDMPLGDGTMTFGPTGYIDFGISADVDLLGAASFRGKANGWVQNGNFNVTGSGTGCIGGVLCADASGVVSSTGIAGCVDAGTVTLYEPVNARTGPFGFGSISFNLKPHTIPLRAGFGHRFGTSTVDLLGNSCDFSPYSTPRGTAARAATTSNPLTERVAPDTKALSLRIHGTDGPPQVVLRGPNGTTIRTSAGVKATQRKGQFVLAQNASTGTTDVLLVKPAAGNWTIAATSGARSKPTRIQRASYEGPPVLVGMVRKRGARRELAIAYSLPAGARLRLVERAKGISRTIAKQVRGGACRGNKGTLPGGRMLRCARLAFQPSNGPGGTRRIEAVVTRGGIPLASKKVVSFRAPREVLPARPGALRLQRTADGIVAIFPLARGASRYNVTAVLTDGRSLGFDLRSNCRAVTIPAVATTVGATVKVAGLRYDMRNGKYRSGRLAAGKRASGPKRPLPRRICS